MRHSGCLVSTVDALRLVFLTTPTHATSRPSACRSLCPRLARRCNSTAPQERFVIWRSGRPSDPPSTRDYGPRPNTYGSPPEGSFRFSAASPSKVFGPRTVREGNGPLRDEQIRSVTIRLVDADQKIGPPEHLASVLASIDRKTHFVQQFSQPDDPDVPFPVCKIVDKKENRERERQLAKARSTSPHQTAKRLELSWAIGKHDLEHRMRKVREFLEEGRKVEIIIGAARRKGQVKKAARIGAQEAAETFKSIQQSIADIEGATNWKPTDGNVGAMMTMYVESKLKKKD